MHHKRFLVVLIAGGTFAALGKAEEVRVSHCFQGDHVAAINDHLEPQSPVDGPRKLSSTEVYWLDDTPGGDCPVPESWRLFYHKGGRWVPVENTSPFGVEKGLFNRVSFRPIETTALRIEVNSQAGWGSGIIEWDVRDDPRLARARRIKRLLAPLGGLKSQPRQTILGDLIRRSESLSPPAQQYLARLAEFGRRGRQLQADVESGKIADEAPIAPFAHEVRQFLHGQIWDGRLAWINFSQPRHSPALTAHLAKEAGGRGLGTQAEGQGTVLWQQTDDPDYLSMLHAIEEGRRKMLAHPRVDVQPADP